MKILLYIDEIGGGGAERVMANLANGLAEKGNQIILVTSFPAEREYALSDKVKRYNLEAVPPTKREIIRKNIRRIRKLRTICSIEKCDVAVSFMEGPNFRLLFATMFLTVKTVISLRSDPQKEYSHFFHKILADFIYSCADACVFQTEDAKKIWGKRLRRKGCIILNPVADEFYLEGINKEKRNIVSVGRLIKTKNFELLISAFSEINKMYPEEHLIIYGEGDYRRNLEELILQFNLSKKVMLPGNVDNIPEKIRNAKIFVLSSEYEGMPNALMEAMALGIASIATDCPCGGPDLLLEHGKHGVLVEVGSKGQLKTAIINLLDNPKMRSEYSENARARADLFRNDRVCEEWQKLFHQIL